MAAGNFDQFEGTYHSQIIRNALLSDTKTISLSTPVDEVLKRLELARKSQLLNALLEHVEISLIALFFSLIIAIPLGI
ncbi:hypothetical protein [Bacillus sp. UNC41MFS5]|uniref:hypothetical protein n=1 Tax=Bacillus sp. UNC41MFS5 TaxID=1449046 RepID=UPI000AF65689